MLKQIKKGAMHNLALQGFEDNVDYEFTDYPEGSITNLQMSEALTEEHAGILAPDSVYLCLDDGDIGAKNHFYRFKETAWEDVTPN